jgi:hypothetical protein
MSPLFAFSSMRVCNSTGFLCPYIHNHGIYDFYERSKLLGELATFRSPSRHMENLILDLEKQIWQNRPRNKCYGDEIGSAPGSIIIWTVGSMSSCSRSLFNLDRQIASANILFTDQIVCLLFKDLYLSLCFEIRFSDWLTCPMLRLFPSSFIVQNRQCISCLITEITIAGMVTV